MKRLLPFFITITMLATIITPCCYVVNEKRIKKETVAFCDKVAELNRKYQSLDIIETKNETGNDVNAQYENRLIVKSSDNIIHNAAEAVEGPTYTVLQYKSKEALNKDYNKLIKQGIAVEKDYIFHSSTASSTADEAAGYGGAYSYCGVDYAKNHFAQNAQDYDDIVIGVIDTGIYYYHEIYKNRYIESNINYSTTGKPDDVLDDNGHGTATSSIILMSTPDNVKVKGYKVLNSSGTGSFTAVLSAIEYIISEKERPDIINLSLGGYELTSNVPELIDDALLRLSQKGVTICAAAGNEYVPAHYNAVGGSNNVITVASCNSFGEFSDFSDYGSAVDITAPGEEIYCAKKGTTSTYTSSGMTGTSVASPFVASGCAYIKMQHPHYSPQKIKSTIKQSAVKVSPDDEYYFGSGIFNCINLIEKENAAEISINLAGGEYESEQLELEFDQQDNSDIYYSLCAGMPLTRYTGQSITINENTTISYALCSNGEFISDIKSDSYIFNYTATASDVKISLGIITAINAPNRNINLIIPDSIDGKIPTTIALNTFSAKKYNKVTLPDSVTALGTSCFNGSAITELTALGVSKFTGDSVFKDCKKLKRLNMPELETITEYAFDGCESLNFIDFADNIKKLQTRAFASTAIINAEFKNAEYPLLSCTEVFYNAKIFTCSLPKIDTLCEGLFNNCVFLYELNTKPVKAIHSNALKNTAIKEMDLSKLTRLFRGALSGVSIENFYAPGVTEIYETSTVLTNSLGAKFNHCETINLPNLTGALCENSIYYSTVKNLILPNITSISSSKTFYNLPMLEYVYLPNAVVYNSPAYSVATNDEILGNKKYCVYSEPEMVFIPNATKVGKLIFRNFGTLYATGLNELDISITDATSPGNIIVSDKIDTDSLTISCTGASPNVIAPQSADINGDFNFVSLEDCCFEGYNDKLLTYSCNDSEFEIPFDYIKDMFTPDLLNKDTSTSDCILFDFYNDEIINAKDFAIFRQIEKESE